MTRCRPWVLTALLGALLAGAALADDLPTDVEVRRLAENVWVHTSYVALDDGVIFPSHGLIVREGDALTLIDTAWGEEKTKLLLDAIAVQIGLPVTRVIVTHAHDDRLGGADLLMAEGVEVWAHPMTQQLAFDRQLPVPNHVIEGIEIPGSAAPLGALEVFYPGPAHTDDNIMVWLPGPGILFGGCAIRGADAGGMGNVSDGDIEGWVTAMALTGQYYDSAQTVVPSHSDPGGVSLISHTAELAGRAQDQNQSED